MPPQNDQNYYSINIYYPGVKYPDCACAATGCAIGYFCGGHPVAACLVGTAIGSLYEDWLKQPHLINSGGIEVNNRSITLHPPSRQHINRD